MRVLRPCCACLAWCDGDVDWNVTHCTAWSHAGCGGFFLLSFLACLASETALAAVTRMWRCLCRSPR